jgi:DNA-binding Xre family transcriptional regulator
MNIGTRVTISYIAMTTVGMILMILPKIYLNLSLDLLNLIALNTSTIIFMSGDAISIAGLHEVCHCLYCKIKDIEIIGALAGFRGLGIKVKKDYRQEVRLSSLFCIPIAVGVSALLLPLWVLLFNTGFACASCIDDITCFLRDQQYLFARAKLLH